MTALATAVEDYLRLRRSLGFKLNQEGTLLPDLVAFLERHGASCIVADLALRWAMQPVGVQPAHWASRLRMARRFAMYRSATDPRTEIPPAGLLPHRPRRAVPHLYSDAELANLLQAAHELKSKIGLRRHTYGTLLGLLAATGMRAGEVIALDREDVDLQRGILSIRHGKFGKARLVPVHASTLAALQEYGERRDRLVPRCISPAFFVGERGQRLTYWILRGTFVQLSHRSGLRQGGDRTGPRLHDFRHTFAVRTLLGWYRTGADVERQLPALSTYLGHGHVTDTYWYLTAIPELLALAARRLDGEVARP